MSAGDTLDRPAPETGGGAALPGPAAAVAPAAYIRGWAPIWVPIPVNAAVTFWMFTVVHDASHYAISSKRWVNALVGRLAWVFVVPMYAFPAFAYIHIEHHRHSNDDANDPDTFASHGRPWLLPFRWALAEVYYGSFYLRRARSRPTTEIAETAVMLTASVAGLIVAIVTGNL